MTEATTATLADYALLPPTLRMTFQMLTTASYGPALGQTAALAVGGINVLNDFGYDKAYTQRMARIAFIAAGADKALAAGAVALIRGWVADYEAGVANDGAEVLENLAAKGENAPGAANLHPSLVGIERNKASAPASVPDLELEPMQSPQEVKLRANAAMAAERWNERTKGR